MCAIEGSWSPRKDGGDGDRGGCRGGVAATAARITLRGAEKTYAGDSAVVNDVCVWKMRRWRRVTLEECIVGRGGRSTGMKEV